MANLGLSAAGRRVVTGIRRRHTSSRLSKQILKRLQPAISGKIRGGSINSMSTSHSPVVADDDNPGLVQAICKFVPMIVVYAIRHLTVGALVRYKLKNFEARGEKWIIEEERLTE